MGGTWPNKRPIYRAAKYDGYFPDAVVASVSPQDWVKIQDLMASKRGNVSDFDLGQYGVTPGGDTAAAYNIVAAYEVVGVTWWVEGISPLDYGFGMADAWTQEIVEKLIRRVGLGPPKFLG